MSCKVSIITRTKDRPHLLRRAFSSVQNQGFADWEHIIVNDGGDASPVEALVAAFPDEWRERIRVLHHAEAKGMQDASNAGIEAATGEYICIHDDDDQWHPDYLGKAVAFLEREGKGSPYQGVISATEEVREAINASGEVTEIERSPYIPLDEISLYRIGYENPFPPIAFCFRRSAWESLGGFDPRWDVIGDMDFNLRFLRKYEIGVIPEPLAFYHIRERSEDPACINSIRDKQALHKRLFTELKNTYLRRAQNPADGALSVALNTAGYLVEAQWILHDVYHRARQNQEAIETLGKSIALDGYEDRFTTLREALAILIDHARDTGVRSELACLRTEMSEQVKAREALGRRLEELIGSAGLPAERDAFETIRQALNILVEHARSPLVAEQLQHISEQLKEAGHNRHKTADRLEQLIRSVGLLPEENAKAHDNLLTKLTQLVDFTRDPSRNGQAAKEEILRALEARANQGKDLASQLSALEAGQRSHFHELNRTFGATEERLNARFEAVEERLNARFEAIEERLTEMEKALDAERRKFWQIRLGRFSLAASSDRRNGDS